MVDCLGWRETPPKFGRRALAASPPVIIVLSSQLNLSFLSPLSSTHSTFSSGPPFFHLQMSVIITPSNTLGFNSQSTPVSSWLCHYNPRLMSPSLFSRTPYCRRQTHAYYCQPQCFSRRFQGQDNSTKGTPPFNLTKTAPIN